MSSKRLNLGVGTVGNGGIGGVSVGIRAFVRAGHTAGHFGNAATRTAVLLVFAVLAVLVVLTILAVLIVLVVLIVLAILIVLAVLAILAILVVLAVFVILLVHFLLSFVKSILLLA